MHPHIGDVVEPVPSLLIEIGVIEERAAVDEIVAQVADGPLDFALGLRAIRATRARREAPVMREAEKLEIAHERAALQPQVARDHRLHLIEEQLLRDAAERAKRLLEPVDQRPHVLARIEPAPQQPRVAEHDEQGVAHAPRKRNRAKSTCACRPAGVSKRITGSGGGVGRTCRTNAFSCV